jgi:hypothetical protein
MALIYNTISIHFDFGNSEFTNFRDKQNSINEHPAKRAKHECKFLNSISINDIFLDPDKI